MDSTITWKPVKDLVRIIINRDGNGKITQDNEPGKVNVEEYHTPDGSIVPYALCSLKGERSYKRALDGIAGNSWHGFTLTAQLGQIVAKNFVFLEQRTDNKNPIALESLSPIKDESILQRSQRIVHPYSPRRLVRGQQQVLRATMTTSFYRGPRNQRSSSQVNTDLVDDDISDIADLP